MGETERGESYRALRRQSACSVSLSSAHLYLYRPLLPQSVHHTVGNLSYRLRAETRGLKVRGALRSCYAEILICGCREQACEVGLRGRIEESDG